MAPRGSVNKLRHAFQTNDITKTRLFKYIDNLTIRNWKFSDKNSDSFHNSAQNIDCGYSLEPPRRGGSNENPQSMFFSRNKKKKNVYPCKPQFYYIKVGFKGVKIILVRFRDEEQGTHVFPNVINYQGGPTMHKNKEAYKENKDLDQHVHPRILISDFAFGF